MAIWKEPCWTERERFPDKNSTDISENNVLIPNFYRWLTTSLFRALGLKTIIRLCFLISLLSLWVLWAQVSTFPEIGNSSCGSSSRSSMLLSTGEFCFVVTVLNGTAFAIRVSLRTLQLDPPYFFMFIKSPMLPLTLLLPSWRFVRDKAGECGSDSEHFSVDLTMSGRIVLLWSLSRSDKDDPRRIFARAWRLFFENLSLLSFSPRFTLFEDNDDFIANRPAFKGNNKAHSVDFSRVSIV